MKKKNLRIKMNSWKVKMAETKIQYQGHFQESESEKEIEHERVNKAT